MRFTVQSGSGEFGSFRVILDSPEAALKVANELMERGAARVRIVDQQDRTTEPERLGRDLHGHNLSADQIALIMGTADVLTAVGTPAADLFYDKLFELAPEVRGLFRDDLARQKRKLLDTLAGLLELVGEAAMFKDVLRNLGLRHVAYGARPEHYGPVGQALLHSLATLLGDRFTAEVRTAWTTLYLDVAAWMTDTPDTNQDGDASSGR